MKPIYRTICLQGAFAVAVASTSSLSWAQVDMQRISRDALVKAPETVDCTLENGVAAKCAKLVVRHQPKNLKIGPFCRSLAAAQGI